MINKQSKNILSEKDTYIGIRNDSRSGKIHLDVSKRYDTAKEARIACKKSGHTAYYDLQMLENINVNKKY